MVVRDDVAVGTDDHAGTEASLGYAGDVEGAEEIFKRRPLEWISALPPGWRRAFDLDLHHRFVDGLRHLREGFLQLRDRRGLRQFDPGVFRGAAGADPVSQAENVRTGRGEQDTREEGDHDDY